MAYSGGVDSTALLWVTARMAQPLGLRVLALHVHHGLQPEADAWVAHANTVVALLAAQGLPVALQVARLDGVPPPGASVEAWARRERYAALARLAHSAGVGLILLAQHAQDQAETVLLQALRGGGPAGLSAMPAQKHRQGITWARPWLGQPRERVLEALAASGLPAVQDPSNSDRRYARSRLRQAVWPALQAAFPQAATVLAEVARHAAQARALADEVATADVAVCVDGDGRLLQGPWLRLSPARRRNALTAWLAARLPGGVPVSLVDRVVMEWSGLGRRWPVPGGWLCSRRRALVVELSSGAK